MIHICLKMDIHSSIKKRAESATSTAKRESLPFGLGPIRLLNYDLEGCGAWSKPPVIRFMGKLIIWTVVFKQKCVL